MAVEPREYVIKQPNSFNTLKKALSEAVREEIPLTFTGVEADNHPQTERPLSATRTFRLRIESAVFNVDGWAISGQDEATGSWAHVDFAKNGESCLIVMD